MAGNSLTQRVEGELASPVLQHAEILEHANDAIIVTDVHHRIVIWNCRAEELYGFEKEEVLGKNVMDTIVPKRRRKRAARILRTLDHDSPYSGEFPQVTKEGREIPVRISVRPIFDSSGRKVGFLGINNDISEIKRNEERIRRQKIQLETFKEVASAISNPMPTKEVLQRAIRLIVKAVSADAGGICLLDGSRAAFSSVAVDGAPEWLEKEVSSYSLESSFSGRVIASGKGLLIHDARNPKRKRWVLPATLKAGFRSLTGVPLVGKKGTLGTLEVLSFKPNQFKSRDLRFLTVLGHQVAGAVENAVLRDGLRKALRAESRLVREARHRLTNNLQSIASLLSTAVASERWTGDGKAAIDSAVQRISGMAAIQQQMDLDGLEGIELAEAIERMEGCLREIHGQQHEISFAVKGRGAKLSSSLAGPLAIAINELVWNSCAHAFDVGQRGSVAIEASVSNGVAKVVIKDNGKGIPEDFDLERDADTGLSIVKNIVERDLNGRLSLSRKEGTTATITWAAACGRET
jgi:PAS domain S-box-containing protein